MWSRSVFLGMLKMADEDPDFFPLLGIVPSSSLPAEIDASGTIFAVKDLPRICEAVFGAWMLLHKQPSCIEKQMASVLEFLDRAKQQKIMPMLPLPIADAGVDDGGENLCSSKKRDWDTFKLCLQDADIVPVDLMVTRMMRKNAAGSGDPPAALLDFCENRDRVCRRMPCDWQDCKYWFVPHMVRHGADGRTAVQRFTGWGLVDYTPMPSLPPGVGGGEDAAEAGEEDVPRLTLEERERKAKAGGPFHALVVDAARKAIESVLSELSDI